MSKRAIKSMPSVVVINDNEVLIRNLSTAEMKTVNKTFCARASVCLSNYFSNHMDCWDVFVSSTED